MGKVCLIYGESGSGKSASLRNFEPNELGIFNISRKPLPFKKKLLVANTDDYEIIKSTLRENNKNCYVLDDVGLAMTFFLFNRCLEPGYTKFTQAAKDFYDLVQTAIRDTTDDTIVYFIMHMERSEDGTKMKAKTAGKMIDSQITLESLFTIVLYAYTDGKKHVFVTQSDGITTAKSPMEMFPLEVENDLKAVDSAIREYYEIAPLGEVKKEKKKGSSSVSTSDTLPKG